MKQLVNLAEGNNNFAYLYVIMGNLSLAISQILFKSMTKYLTPFQGIVVRSCFVSSILYLLLRRDNISPYLKSRSIFKQVVFRIMLNGFSFITMLYCLRQLPVSTVSTLFNTGPIFIFFIEAMSSKAPMNLNNFCLTMLSFLGVVLMIQPQFIFGESQVHKQSTYYLFVGLSLFSALGNAINLHLIHGLGKVVDPIVNMYYSHITLILYSGVLNNFQPQHIKPIESIPSFVILILGVGIFGFFAQNMIVLANTFKKPSTMMPFGYVGVATGFIADVYLFGISFTFLSVLGVFLTSGGLLSGFLLEKKQTQNKATNKQRQQIPAVKNKEENQLSQDSKQSQSPKNE